MKLFSIIFLILLIPTILHPQKPFPRIATVTYAGKAYNIVHIGTQYWLEQNLDVGTMIQASQNASNNGTIEKYCYNNDPVNCTIYGGLYQWNEAMAYSKTPGTQGICPDGFHIPTYAEFQTLQSTVGDDHGNALKAIGQGTGYGIGTNTTGFSALLAGSRFDISFFNNLGYIAYFWSSIEVDANYADFMNLDYCSSNVYLNQGIKAYGLSVRCLQDGTVDIEKQNNLPKDFYLSQNYPNPFNPSTRISLSLPKTAFVTLKVYNISGQEVKTLLNMELSAGKHEISFNGSNLSSGIYFYKLQANEFTKTMKMSLLK